MSLLPFALTLALSCLGGGAAAQEADGSHYDGTWTASLPCRTGGGVCRARLVIADFEGTWQDLSRNTGKGGATRACGGRKMPLTVQSSTRSRLAFTVFGDGVSATCPTLSVFVKPVGEKALEGSVAAGPHAAEPPEVHARHAAPADEAASAAAGADGSVATTAIRLQRR